MDEKYLKFKNDYIGHIPDYWKIPLSKYTNEVCFVTADSVVAAPKLLLKAIFPKFDSLLCPSCSDGHDRVTIIIKEIGSDQIQEAFKKLASGDSGPLADILELQFEDNTQDNDAATEIENKENIQDEEEGEVRVKSEAVIPKEDDDIDQTTTTTTNPLALLSCGSCDFVASTDVMLEAHMDDCNLTVSVSEVNVKSKVNTVFCNYCESPLLATSS